MADGFAANIRLGHFLHRNSALHSCGYPRPLQAILQGDCIHHGGKHAHVIGGGAIHPGGGALQPPEDVTPAHHDGELGSRGHHGGYITGDRLHNRRIDAVTLGAHQGFATQLEKNAPVSHRALHSCEQ